MMFAKRLSGIPASFIRDMTRLAMRYHAINLSQGFPDFDPPPEMIEAAHRALDGGANQYTNPWGLVALRQAIAEKMERWYGLDFEPDQHITITCGVTEALRATLMGIVNPGDEVIIIEPFHEGFLPAAVFAGAIPRFVPIIPPDYALDLDRLRTAFSPRVRAIILNTPHNPTGRVFTRTELEGIAELCQEYDVVAVTDEIYEHIIYDDHPHIPLATLPGMRERTVTISGFSKTYAATGWRIGYACAHNKSLSDALRTVHDFTTICAPVPLQAGCVAGLNLPDEYYKQLHRDYSARRDKMMSILKEANLTAHKPEGSYYVMAEFSAWDFDGDDIAFARWLPEHLGVAVVPGSCFYATPGLGKNVVRFAFPKKIETLEAAGRKLREGMKKV